VGHSTKVTNWFKTHFQDVIAVIFILVFTISGIATLKEYGINWDEGLGNLFFGERNLYYFRTFDTQYLDFSAQNSYLNNLPLNASLSPWINTPQAFPPFFDTISAGSMHVFSYKLHWLDPVDGFHLATILFAALFLVVFYFFISKRLGRTVALIGIVMIGTFPRFFGDMHFNEKDIPEMLAFGLAVISYYCWYESKTWKRAVLAGILTGIAWAIKVNAVFLPFIFILGIWRWDFKNLDLKESWTRIKESLFHHLLMILAAIHVFFLSWPWLWADPRRFLTYLQIFSSQNSLEAGRVGSGGFSFTPLLLTLTTMPEYLLFFLIIGLCLSVLWVIRKKNPILRLLIVWMIVPIFRVSIPGTVNFDGIRHFLEFLPATAVLAAFGVITAINSIKWQKTWLRRGIILFLLVASIFNFVGYEIAYYPYEYLYYNHLIGTRQNAAKAFGRDQVSDYWAITYRKGMAWLKQNAVQDSYLYVPIAEWSANITQRVWLRADIQTIDRNQMEEIRKTDAPIYVMFINRPAFYDDIANICIKKGTPVYQIDLLGSSLMQIYRFDEIKH
jgi:hypothetical protein